MNHRKLDVRDASLWTIAGSEHEYVGVPSGSSAVFVVLHEREHYVILQKIGDATRTLSLCVANKVLVGS